MLSSRFISPIAVVGMALLGAAAQADVTFLTGTSGWTDISTLADNPSAGNSDPFAAFTASDFTNAASGAAAVTLTTLASGWVTGLPSSAAQWIGISSTAGTNGLNSYSALYAYTFNYSATSDAVLNLTFSVDDQLGDTVNQGIYLNGYAIPGTVSNVDWNEMTETKSYDLSQSWFNSSGTQTLYFNVWNEYSGPSGLLVQGTVAPVPEPFTMSLAVAGIGLAVRRRRQASSL